MNHSAAALLLSLALSMAPVAQANPKTVTFENIPATGIADGYGGISGWPLAGNIVDGAGEGVDNYLFYGPATSTGELRFDGAPVVFHGTYYKSYAADWANPITSISLFYRVSGFSGGRRFFMLHRTASCAVPIQLLPARS